MSKDKTPANEKLTMTVAEAAIYSGIGEQKIREMAKKEGCPFALKVGSRKLLIKRQPFEEYILSQETL